MNLRLFNALQGVVVNISDLSKIEQLRMFRLMNKYYESVSEDDFLKDLFDKDQVILLRHPKTRLIEGFTTLKRIEITMDGRSVRGIFSGDTIVERCFWGSRVLGRTFLKYMIKEKLRRPFKPLLWFLISKGYKTYLLMANNFYRHYPRYERPTPAFFKKVCDRVYSDLYQEKYDKSSGLLTADENSCRLKEGVAAPEGGLKHPRIAYFERVNPSWKQGTELCCVAVMPLLLPLHYWIKSMARIFSRQLKSKRKALPLPSKVKA